MPKIVDREARRRELIQATWRVISRVGIEHTTVREIAREVGWSAGMIAHYFATKDDLLLAALEHMHERVMARAARRVERLDGVEALRAVLMESLPLDAERRREMQVEVSFWARAIANPELTAIDLRELDMWTSYLERLVRRAIELGELVPVEDVGLAVETLAAGTEGIGQAATLHPRRYPPARQLAVLDALLAPLLTARAPVP